MHSLCLNVHDLSLVVHLHADNGVELAALDESRDERVTIHLTKVVRVDSAQRLVHEGVPDVDRLIDNLDADVEVEIAVLELFRVDKGAAARAANGAILDTQRSADVHVVGNLTAR